MPFNTQKPHMTWFLVQTTGNLCSWSKGGTNKEPTQLKTGQSCLKGLWSTGNTKTQPSPLSQLKRPSGWKKPCSDHIYLHNLDILMKNLSISTLPELDGPQPSCHNQHGLPAPARNSFTMNMGPI